MTFFVFKHRSDSDNLPVSSFSNHGTSNSEATVLWMYLSRLANTKRPFCSGRRVCLAVKNGLFGRKKRYKINAKEDLELGLLGLGFVIRRACDSRCGWRRMVLHFLLHFPRPSSSTDTTTSAFASSFILTIYFILSEYIHHAFLKRLASATSQISYHDRRRQNYIRSQACTLSLSPQTRAG